jgi:phosphatidate phosphatase PAH1
VVGSLNVEVPFSVFFFGQGSRLVVTDIDGTITESDVKGVVYPQLGMEAHQVKMEFLTFSVFQFNC